MAAPLLVNYQLALAQGTADTAPPDTTNTSSVDGSKSPAFFTWVVDSAIGSDSNAAEPKVTQRAEINAGGLELGQRSLQAASDIPCDATYCITEGESLTLTYTCSSDFPQGQLKCVMISGPSGARFESTEGNPATGTLTWTNAGPPGTYSIKIQAEFTVCPAGITCEDSPVLTETITVTKAKGKDCDTNYVWDKEKKACVPDCENHPEELGCNPEPPTYCDNNPSDPECKPGKSKFCEENPNHVYCDPNVVDLCNRNPEFLHCTVFLTEADLECIAQGGLLKPGRICDFEAAQERWDASVKKACRTEPNAPLCQRDPENQQILDYCRNASPFNAFCRALGIAPAICYVASAPGCDYFFGDEEKFCKFDPNAEQCKPKGPK